MANNQDFKELLMYHWRTIAATNEMLATLAVSDNPIISLMLQSDISTYQRLTNEIEEAIAMACGFKRLVGTVDSGRYMGCKGPLDITKHLF